LLIPQELNLANPYQITPFFASKTKTRLTIEDRRQKTEDRGRKLLRTLSAIRYTLTSGANIRLVIDIPNWLENILIQPVLLYRWARYGHAFRTIPLTRGKFAIVDAEDYPKLNKYKWHTVPDKCTCYAARDLRLPQTCRYIRTRMHQQILNPPAGFCVDHINHNGLDNRKANLRLATHSQNCCNRRKTSTGTWSRYKGVSWRIHDKCWTAAIKINSQTKFLGRFRHEVEAAKAYDAAAHKYYGEFAALNFENGKLSVTARLRFWLNSGVCPRHGPSAPRRGRPVTAGV